MSHPHDEAGRFLPQEHFHARIALCCERIERKLEAS